MPFAPFLDNVIDDFVCHDYILRSVSFLFSNSNLVYDYFLETFMTCSIRISFLKNEIKLATSIGKKWGMINNIPVNAFGY